MSDSILNNRLVRIILGVSGIGVVYAAESDDFGLSLGTYIKSLFFVFSEKFSNVVSDLLYDFLSSTRSVFINIGSNLSGALYLDDFNIFTDNFYFWVLGVLLGTFIFVYTLKTFISYISSLFDPM